MACPLELLKVLGRVRILHAPNLGMCARAANAAAAHCKAFELTFVAMEIEHCAARPYTRQGNCSAHAVWAATTRSHLERWVELVGAGRCARPTVTVLAPRPQHVPWSALKPCVTLVVVWSAAAKRRVPSALPGESVHLPCPCVTVLVVCSLARARVPRTAVLSLVGRGSGCGTRVAS